MTGHALHHRFGIRRLHDDHSVSRPRVRWHDDRGASQAQNAGGEGGGAGLVTTRRVVVRNAHIGRPEELLRLELKLLGAGDVHEYCRCIAFHTAHIKAAPGCRLDGQIPVGVQLPPRDFPQDSRHVRCDVDRPMQGEVVLPTWRALPADLRGTGVAAKPRPPRAVALAEAPTDAVAPVSLPEFFPRTL